MADKWEIHAYDVTPTSGDAADHVRSLSDRSSLISHLHKHSDHASHYPAGHDFVLVSTEDIRSEHGRKHGLG
jgi:hypothetical protein